MRAALKKIGFMVVLSGCLLLPSSLVLYADHDHGEGGGEETGAGGGPSAVGSDIVEIRSDQFFNVHEEVIDRIANHVFDLLAKDLIPEVHASDTLPQQVPSLPAPPVEIFQEIPADDFASHEVRSVDEIVDELLNA